MGTESGGLAPSAATYQGIIGILCLAIVFLVAWVKAILKERNEAVALVQKEKDEVVAERIKDLREAHLKIKTD